MRCKHASAYATGMGAGGQPALEAPAGEFLARCNFFSFMDQEVRSTCVSRIGRRHLQPQIGLSFAVRRRDREFSSIF